MCFRAPDNRPVILFLRATCAVVLGKLPTSLATSELPTHSAGRFTNEHALFRSILVEVLEQNYSIDGIAILYLYNDYREQDQQSAVNLVGSLLQQPVRGSSSLLADIIELHRDHTSEQTRPTASDLLRIIQAEIVRFSKVFILVDTMDECSKSKGTRDTVLTTLQNLLGSPNTR